MTMTTTARRITTIVGVAIILALVVGTIRLAAAWTAAAAPLTVAPVSAAELQVRLADERARSAALASQLTELDARSRDLTAALEQAEGRIATDATNAEELDGQLAAAKARLAKLEAMLASTRQAVRATTTSAAISAPAARTSGDSTVAYSWAFAAVTVAGLGGVVALNRSLYRFLLARRGVWFAGGAFVLHCFYYLYSTAAFTWCWVGRLLGHRGGVAARARGGAAMPSLDGR